MFFLVFLLSSILADANADTQPTTETLDSLFSDAFSCVKDRRAVTSIVWSCLTVMVACTWLSVHPNIPSVRDAPATVLRRKLGIMLIVLIAPELVLVWALRQWFGAREIVKRYSDRGWTLTHGFFLIMGGFAISATSAPSTSSVSEPIIYPLDVDTFHHHITNGTLTFPDVTVDEIKDRSKADWLAKTIIIFQTTWFIVQCAARGWSPSTDLTELEVLTLAFASLNAGIYFFWWHKPLDVHRPIRLSIIEELVNLGGPNPTSISSSSNDKPRSSTPAPRPTLSARVLVPICRIPRLILRLPIEIIDIIGDLVGLSEDSSYPSSSSYPYTYTSYPRSQSRSLSLYPTSTPAPPERVPTFYSPALSSSSSGSVIALSVIIGAAFGAVHFVAWNTSVPTSLELLLWRIPTVIITATFLVSTIAGIGGIVSRGIDSEWCIPVSGVIFPYLHAPIIPFYLLSRLMLFGLAFASLRDLPPAAYKEIEWTSYLPHFG